MQNTSYKNTFAISQTSIKDFRFKSPKKWKTIWIDKQIDIDKDEDNFVFGSLVDTLLFTPKELTERFFIANSNDVPTGAVAKIIKTVYDEALATNLIPGLTKLEFIDNPELPEPEEKITYNFSKLENQIIKACEKEEWNSNWKPDTKFKKIVEKGEGFFDLLIQSEGKKVISSEMNLEAVAMVNMLKKSPICSQYFTNKNNIFQLELFIDYTSKDFYTLPLKAAIDILHIDRANKTLRLVDFKTSYDSYNFLASIKKFGYCDQLSFYHYMLQQALSNGSLTKYDINESYTLLEPLNIVIDKEDKLPYIYEYSWDDINLSKEGNREYLFQLFQSNYHNAKIRKGWNELLNEIAWHVKHNMWDYPVEFYKEGKIKINLTNA